MTAGTETISPSIFEQLRVRLKRIADAFCSFLLLPRGYTNWIWRLLGICAIVDGIQIHDWLKYEATPYIVPAWRFGSDLLVLKVLPHSLFDPLFAVFFIAASLMALGVRSKWILSIPVLTLTYFCAM